jgi:gliding motility-associated-like protein
MKKTLSFLLVSLLLLTSSVVSGQDFSNKGTDFWVVYMGHIDGTNSRMALYITSDQNASGTVSVGGSVTSFSVTANQVTTVRFTNTSSPSNALAYNDQVTGIGTNRGIHIVSDHPVVVYSHILNAARSGSTLILPTAVLGREYYVSSYKSVAASGGGMRRSEFAVVATEDSTAVEITPTIADANNTYAPNIPFQVLLNKGDVFQYQSANDQDLTGSHVKSVATPNHPCKPVAVFSGSTWTAIGCSNSTSGDNLYQQLFPFTSWGKLYYTAPFTKRSFDIFRILVQDAATVVKVNGVVLAPSGLVGGRYYEISTQGDNSSRIIEADKPICVLQYLITQNCDNVNSDPEMIILNSVDQTLNDITVMSARSDLTPPATNITNHYLNIIFKTATLGSLKIDGQPPSATPVSIAGTGYSYIQEDVTASTNVNPSHRVTSDSGFICIAYGYGNVESYGYNAGTNVKDLYQFVSVQNQYATVDFPATCRNAPFYFEMTFPYQPTQIQWVFKGLFPDVTVNSPVPDSTWFINGKQLYKYRLPGVYSLNSVGIFPIKVIAQNPTAEGCSGEQVIDYNLQVFERPRADFTFSGSGCLPDSIRFLETANSGGRPAIKWQWNFGDGTTSSNKNTSHLFAAAGSYDVSYSIITDIGCVSDTAVKTVAINALPVPGFTVSSPGCANQNITITDASTSASGNIATWTWDLADGTTLATNTNSPFTHAYVSTGNYTIKLKAQTEKGCADSTTKTITISPVPVAGFLVPDNCINDPFVQFNDTSSIADGSQSQLAYQWSFGDPNAGNGNPNTSSVKNPQHKYTAVGNYDVSLTVTSNAGCVSSVTHPFTVNGALPQSSFTINGGDQQCSNKEVSITNNSTVDFGSIVKMEIYWDYASDPTNKTIITHPLPGATYQHLYPEFFTPATKDYVINVVAYSGDNCLNTSSKTLTLKATPQVFFDPMPGLCANQASFQITQGGITNSLPGAGVFSGAGVSSTGLFNPKVAGAGNHTIRFTFTAANGCVNFKEQTVSVFAVPAIDAGPDKFVLEGGSTVLSGTGSGNNISYAWSPPTWLNNVSIPQPTVTPTDDIVYKLTGTSADGCIASDEVSVKVLKTPTIPNTFSPNGDGIHDTWEIKYLDTYPGCTVEIYNRYGQLVYQSKGYNRPWDGTLKNKPLPAGTYYYIINPKNGRKQMSGFVDIIR